MILKNETPAGADTGGRDEGALPGQAARYENTTIPAPLEPCAATMAEFVGMIANAYEGRDGLIEIGTDTPPRAPGERASLNNARLFAPGEAEAMLRFAERANRAGRNVYIGPALRRPDAPRNKRTADTDATTSCFVWADFDAEGALKEALAALEAMGAEPNWVTITGEHPHCRGQVFWLLDDDAPLDDLRDLHAAIAERFSGDPSVQNIGRVLRLAGSLAWPRKPGRKCELTRALHEHTRAAPYRFDDLAMLAPKRVKGADIQHDGATEELEPGLTREQIEHLLREHNPDMPYSDWLKVGMAVHHETRGAGWGLELWNQWSASGQKYQPGEPGQKWATFKLERQTAVTLASLRHMAKQSRAHVNGAGLERADGASKPLPSGPQRPLPPGDPEPLMRPMGPAEPFPLEAVPQVMQAGVKGVVGRTLVDPALAAQSVMAAWSLVAQAHANVRTINGTYAPLSLNILTIAKSGERKTAADSVASGKVANWEAALRQQAAAQAEEQRVKLQAWKKAEQAILSDKKAERSQTEDRLRALGPPPRPPFTPLLTCPEPTFQGLCKLLAEGLGFAGVFSSEGGQFIGGHGLKKDEKLMTATALSDIWDGKPIKRVRGGDGVQILPGRRVALHLMVQPNVADAFIGDPLLLGQGLLARFLIAWPESRMGERMFREASREEIFAQTSHDTALWEALALPPPRPPDRTDKDDPGELWPRGLTLTSGARDALIEFSDWCEELLRPGNPFSDPLISGFANKLCEHATRIAGVFTFAENIAATEVSEATAEAAITVARWYADERLRIVEAGAIDPNVQTAEALRAWLFDVWDEVNISASDVAQFGPNSIRDAERAREGLELLASKSWLEPLPSGGDVKGKRRRVAWRIRREAAP